MIKKSTVKQAKYLNKTWEGHGKTFYLHGIAFDNGDFGEYMSVSQDQQNFIVGQETEYELSGSPGRHKIKTVSLRHGSTVEGFSSPQKKDDKNRAFALSYAKDIIVAKLNVTNVDYVFDEMELLQLAETFNAWLGGIDPNPVTSDKADDRPLDTSDQLPF